jgi:aspartokinase-like uncharacterized kinase
VSRPLVIKVGGSLLDWPALPGWLGDYLAFRRAESPVVVAGGGAVTDVVRALDRIHTLGEERSHLLAMHSLDLTARLLAALVPVLDVVERPEGLSTCWNAGRVPIVVARTFLEEFERGSSSAPRLRHTWGVTSDSIAAWLAARLEASELVLLKSTSAAPGTNRREAARLGLVDCEFPEAARGLERVVALNVRDPAARPVVLPS